MMARGNDRLRAALRHAQSVGDTDMVNVLEAALHRRKQRQPREAATRPRRSRIPINIAGELAELDPTTKRERADAIRTLAGRYHVTADAIRKKLRSKSTT